MPTPEALPAVRPAGVARWVDQRGHISLARFRYRVGAAFAGEPVEVVCHGGLVDIFHAGAWSPPMSNGNDPTITGREPTNGGPGPTATVGVTVTRRADATDRSASPAPATGSDGPGPGVDRREVAIVGGSVQLSADDKVIRVHPIRHDRAESSAPSPTPKAVPAEPARPETPQCQVGTGTKLSTGYRTERIGCGRSGAASSTCLHCSARTGSSPGGRRSTEFRSAGPPPRGPRGSQATSWAALARSHARPTTATSADPYAAPPASSTGGP